MKGMGKCRNREPRKANFQIKLTVRPEEVIYSLRGVPRGIHSDGPLREFYDDDDDYMTHVWSDYKQVKLVILNVHSLTIAGLR
jgi:hypothetical protein